MLLITGRSVVRGLIHQIFLVVVLMKLTWKFLHLVYSLILVASYIGALREVVLQDIHLKGWFQKNLLMMTLLKWSLQEDLVSAILVSLLIGHVFVMDPSSLFYSLYSTKLCNTFSVFLNQWLLRTLVFDGIWIVMVLLKG